MLENCPVPMWVYFHRAEIALIYYGGGKEGLTTLTPDRSNGSTVSKKLLLLWRSSWDFDRLLVLSACPPPSPPPSPVRRSSFAELRFPRVDPLGIGKLVVTDISSPLGFSYFIPRSFLASFRGSFSSRAVFFFFIIIISLLLN